MPCIEKDDSSGGPEAIATSIDDNEDHSDSHKRRACGKVKRQHIDRISVKGYIGIFYYDLKDNVKDGEGYKAVFTEQDTSASQMET